MRTLLEFGANPKLADQDGNTPLHFVRSEEICKQLLRARADIHARSVGHQRTALHHLCIDYEDIELVEMLIKAGIDVDVKNNDDETPLLNAIFHGYMKTAEKLIELGADINAANTSSSDNTIHFAVNYNHHEIFPSLLAHNVDYMATNIRLRNIAHMAAISANTQTLYALADSDLKGLDFSVKDVDGRTPADYAGKRMIFSESEEGFQEAFQAFFKSVLVLDQKHDRENQDSMIDPRLLQN